MKKIINVVGAVILDDDKIFCAQRSVNMTLPLMWEFPGGKIEKGELPEDALKREIKEELNIDIDIITFICEASHEYDFGIVNFKSFLCKTNEVKNIQLLEHNDSKWLSVDDLFSLDWAPVDIPTLNEIVKLKKQGF